MSFEASNLDRPSPGILYVYDCPFRRPGQRQIERLGPKREIGYPRRRYRPQSSSTSARHVIERIAQKMHVAALIGRLRYNLAQHRPQAGMIVRHDEFDAVQTARLQPQQEIAPARSTLAGFWQDLETRSGPRFS